MRIELDESERALARFVAEQCNAIMHRAEEQALETEQAGIKAVLELVQRRVGSLAHLRVLPELERGSVVALSFEPRPLDEVLDGND